MKVNKTKKKAKGGAPAPSEAVLWQCYNNQTGESQESVSSGSGSFPAIAASPDWDCKQSSIE